MNEELIRELESIGVCQHACIKAEHTTTDWWTHSRELISKKIVRNYVLGEIAYEGEKFITKYYGNMTLMLDKLSGTIMRLENNKDKRGCNYDRQLKKEINKYLGIDQMVVEEGVKGNVYRHLPIFSKRVFYKYRRFFGSNNTYLDVRKAFGELVVNGTITEQTEEYKYISTAIGKVKVYGENYISYIDVNEDIVNATREEVA